MLLYFHKGQNDMYKHFVFASLRIYIPGIMKSVCIEGFDIGSKTLLVWFCYDIRIYTVYV
jgi:hypothetical protein